MSWTRLSRDVLREIVSMLDLESLEELWATLDRSVHKLLSSSGVIAHLRLVDFPKDRIGLRQYFLRSIRDVGHLHVKGDASDLLMPSWVNKCAPYLSTLNPITLELESTSYSLELCDIRVLTPSLIATALPRLKHLSLGRTPLGTATPSSRAIRCLLASIDTKIEVDSSAPHTLESFYCFDTDAEFGETHNLPPDSSGFDFLPNTLKSLSFKPSSVQAGLPDLFSRLWRSFPTLEVLNLWCPRAGPIVSIFPSISDPSILHTQGASSSTSAPTSLTSVTLQLPSVPTLLLANLESTFGNVSSLHLDFLTSHKKPPASLLPEGLSFPKSLTSVTVSYPTSNWTGESPYSFAFWSAFKDITSLTLAGPPPLSPTEDGYLVLVTDDEATRKHHWSIQNEHTVFSKESQGPFIFYIAARVCYLPPRLTELTLEYLVEPLTEATINKLPTSITLLTVSIIDLTTIGALKQRLPHCRVVVSQPLKLWRQGVQDALLYGEFERFWTPTVDFHGWTKAVTAYCTALNVHFKLSYAPPDPLLATKVMGRELVVPRNPALLNGYNISPSRIFTPEVIALFSAITKLVLDLHDDTTKPLSFSSCFPPCLSHLELNNTPIATMAPLPALKYLSSRATFSYTTLNSTAMLPSITYLDTPRWSFYGGDLVNCRLHDLEKLAMTVEDLADYNVVDFLTKTVNAKTRSNMSVAISYEVTGLLSSLSVQNLKDVSIESVEEATDKALRQALSGPMPVFGTQPTSFGFSTTKVVFGAPAADAPAAASSAKSDAETIGQVLSSLATKPMTTAIRRIFPLPKTATKLKVDYHDAFPYFNLAAAKLSHLEGHGPLKRQFHRTEVIPRDFSVFDAASLSRTLLHLELVRIEMTAWWPILPPTLLFLRVVVARFKHMQMAQGLLTMPPKLMTLIFESTAVATNDKRAFNLADSTPFSFSRLPSSLERIAITASELHLCENDTFSPPELNHLAKLKTLFLSGPTPATLVTLCEKLHSMDNVERIVFKRLAGSAQIVSSRKRSLHDNNEDDEESHFQDILDQVTSEESALRHYAKLRVEGSAPKLPSDLENRRVHGTLEEMINTDVTTAKSSGFVFTSPSKPASADVTSVTSAFASTNLNVAPSASTSASSSFGSFAPSSGFSANRRPARPPRK